jgi:hypothetical protein
MPQTVTGDRLAPEMDREADEFFGDFVQLCRKHGVWLQSRQVLDGEQQATAKAVWRWAPTDTRPAFEIVHS